MALFNVQRPEILDAASVAVESTRLVVLQSTVGDRRGSAVVDAPAAAEGALAVLPTIEVRR